MAGTAARHSAPNRTVRTHLEFAGAYSTSPIAPVMPSGSANATPMPTSASVPAIAGATPPARPSGKPAGAPVRKAMESRGAPSIMRKPRMQSGRATPASPQPQAATVKARSQPRAATDSGAIAAPVGVAPQCMGAATMPQKPSFQPPDHGVDGDRDKDEHEAGGVERVIFATAKPGLRKLGGDERGQGLAAIEIGGWQRGRVAGQQQDRQGLADGAAESQGDRGKQTGQRHRHDNPAQDMQARYAGRMR